MYSPHVEDGQGKPMSDVTGPAPRGLTVRRMSPADVDVRIRYFHGASDEHLELLGVDRAKLPDPDAWRARFEDEHGRPVRERTSDALIWEGDGATIGFSTIDRIEFGVEAYMHLHIVEPDQRRAGQGTELVRMTARHYLDVFELQRLYCEPHAFNVAPNRTLQRAGFRYLLTRVTTPGPLNLRQTTNLWVLEPRT